MTLDETTLTTALHDLAGMVPDNPARLAHVHHLARRRRRRQRAIGAGALAATLAAGGFGAEALASSGRGASRLHPASGGTATPAAAGATTSVAPAPVATVPAMPVCSAPALAQPSNKAEPVPSVGHVFTGGGTISAPGTASNVAIHIDGGPLAGSDLTLSIGPSSRISLDGKPATGAQLPEGTRAKFSATRTATTTYLVDELNAGTPDASAAAKQAAPAVGAPPAVGENFKVGGSVTALTATTITVDVQGGSLPAGPYTFTLKCTPGGPLVGKLVSVVGTRTGESTYDASLVLIQGS